MQARVITRVRMTRIIMARMNRIILVRMTRIIMARTIMARMHPVEYIIGTHILRCIRHIRDMGLGIMDFRYKGLTSITIIIMAGITTGTETSIGTVIIIMDIDPAIIIGPAIIITQGLIIRVVGTMGVGIDEKPDACPPRNFVRGRNSFRRRGQHPRLLRESGETNRLAGNGFQPLSESIIAPGWCSYRWSGNPLQAQDAR